MSESHKLSIRDIVYEWRESAKLGQMSSDTLELLDELETALAASGGEQSDEEHPCTKNDNSCLRLACRFPICANTDDGLEFSSVDEYARKVGIRPASGSESDANNPKDKCAWPTPWGTCEAYRHEHYPSSQHQFVEPQPPALPSRDEIVKAIVLALALFRAENKDVAQQIESKENQER